MSAHPPPVPPEQRPNHGVDPEAEQGSARPASTRNPADSNLEERARQGNIKQNTTNKGYQQDR